MNIYATSASIGKESEIRSNVSSTRATPKASEASGSSDASAKPTTNATGNAGPAATVSISSDARTMLRQAGVSQSEISRINLKDKNAVMRAIQRARMQHGQRASAGKKDATSATNANAASRDVTPNTTKEPEVAAPPKSTSAGKGVGERSAA